MHSKEQIRASSDAGGKSRSQHSQFGLNSSIIVPHERPRPTRIVSEKVSGQVNQRIIIDNRPGAAGNIAVEILAKSTPDGHTLLYS